MYDISQLCNKVKALGYFGSYTREEDYVDDLSDINVFAISSDKSLLIELGSYGFSPLVISEELFKDLCTKGDPICYYVIYDSRIICGELPITNFNLTEHTCKRFRKASISFLKMSYEAYYRQDEKSMLINAVRAMRSLIQFQACKNRAKIPISDSQLRDSCKGLSLNYCDLLQELLQLKKSKIPISLQSLDKIYDIISSSIQLDLNKSES